MLRQLPNLVTLVRILLAPFIFRAIWNREYEWALIWLVIAAFTDILDGFLARLIKVVSRSGAYLDPLADKFLLSGTYFLLGYDRVIPLWMPVIVFGRDVIMLGFITWAYLARGLRSFPPTIWGKLCTLLQIVAAFVILLCGVVSLGPNERYIRTGLMVLAAAVTLWSAVDYLRIGLGMLRDAAKPE